ncbi:hypothetical protein Sa4125_43170 [Aureimonas sp. SA4125]|uniref:HNH endonuclease n=1 Tax=Aureimonas sp. SA4125 TaxID=2826993 RepID=UPI001CC6938D|nr:HNH endonuclease [Aureimonas sp. SA4125]BDA86775.1 hypothetical protein Sa4125_43170 [Aureimonas sp. SA4125]
MTDSAPERNCLRIPVPEIAETARLLDAAVTAHNLGATKLADELIRLADMPAITEWTESLWGVGGPTSRPVIKVDTSSFLPKERRTALRMPTTAEKRALIARDGYHCRFCGIPVVRAEIRSLIRMSYPSALRWGPRNIDQHAAFQGMWLQYDHLLPHARGGTNELANLVVSCAPCNNGRANLTLEEVGISDPRLREPVRSLWDGLLRFRSAPSV